MCLVNEEDKLLVVTQNGFGKRTPVKDYKKQERGGKGILTYDKSKFSKTGELVGAVTVEEDDEVLLINSEAKDVSEFGRATQGVKIMKVEEDANIISMTKVIKEDSEKETD